MAAKKKAKPKVTPAQKIRRNSNNRGRTFEQRVADDLTAAGIEALRVERPNRYVSDTDVKITGMEELKIDCKSRTKFMHHTLFETDVVEKYCKAPGDYAVMPTRHLNQRTGWYVTISKDLFIQLLLAHIEKQKAGGRRIEPKERKLEL